VKGSLMTLREDFASQNYFRSPGTAMEKLRALGPVVEVHFPIVGKVWTTTTQALADQDTETFTIRKDDGTVAGLQWWMPGIVRTLANSMLSMDDPDHKRLPASWTRHFAAALCSTWSRIFKPWVTNSPMNCLQREAQPISLSAMHARCRCR
jgi:hypothetical protein